MGELIAGLENYSIYRVINNTNGVYYLCVPTKGISKCQIYLNFNDKDFSKYTDKRIINAVKNVNDFIYENNSDSIYILLDIPVSILKEAAIENDYPEYTKIINNRVIPIVTEVHDLLVSSGIKKKNINQVIQVVEKNEMDKNFIWWAKQICGDSFINSFVYSKTKEDDDIIDFVTIPITDLPLEQVSSELDVTNNTVTNENMLVKKKVKPKNNSLGFGNFKFIVVALGISIVTCIITFYLLNK